MTHNDKIIVTGATGLVGCHLLVELIRQGYQVRALYRSNSNREYVQSVFNYYNMPDKYQLIQWFKGDITDVDSLHEAFNGIDYVFHTAAMVSFLKSEHKKMWEVNVTATEYVINEAIACNVKGFCHVSSIGALGHTTDNSDIDETTAYQSDSNRTVYSQSKFRQEMAVWQGIESGLKAVIVNPGVILGPCISYRSSGSIAAKMQHGTKFYTDGQTGYVDARDVAKAMIQLIQAEKYGERYILVGENSTVRNLQNLFADKFNVNRPSKKASKTLLNIAATLDGIASILLGRKRLLTFESVRSMGGIRSYSAQKVRNAININFTSLEDSVTNMVNFQNKFSI